MLPLDRQDQYRVRYRHLRPMWQPATVVYEHLAATHLAQLLAAGHAPRVLDIGCGAGGILERLATPDAWACGIDPDRASLQRHRAPIPLVAGDVTHLPFAPATFDLLVCSWVLEHLAQPSAAFREMARVLKSGGHVLFLTPNATHWLIRLNRLVPRVAQVRLVRALYARTAMDTFPVTYQVNTPATVVGVAHTVGLAPVTLVSIADPTYLAFNDGWFAIAVLLDRLLAPQQGIHLVGALVKVAS
jgi:SAM-dependent methyltransferase